MGYLFRVTAEGDNDDDVQRRPDGPYWLCTPDFVAAVRAKVKETSREFICDEVAKKTGYRMDVSNISKITGGSVTSRVAAKICETFGWPVPPLASVSELVAEGAGLLEELRFRDEKRLARAVEDLREIVENRRKPS